MYDDKEQVIEFVLTQHGKRKYAQGEFDPSFYSFSDEDILYDSKYASFDENINEAEDRIFSETPRTSVIHNRHGVDTNFKKLRKQIQQGNDTILSKMYQDEIDRTYSSINTLGTSDINTQNAPAWQVRALAGIVSSSHSVITGSENNIRIPQVNLNTANYEISIIEDIPEEVRTELGFVGISPADASYESLFGDNTITEVVPQEIFIEIDELNTVFRDSNFDIEVFLVEEQNVSVPSGSTSTEVEKEILTPLYFSKKPIEFEPIYDPENFGEDDFEINTSPDEVPYYIDLQVDDEIPQEIVCQYVPRERRRGVYAKYKACDGPRQIILDADLYDTDVTSVDLEDNCDD